MGSPQSGTKTIGSQNRYYLPIRLILKRGPLGYATCSEGVQNGITSLFLTQDFKIGDIQFNGTLMSYIIKLKFFISLHLSRTQELHKESYNALIWLLTVSILKVV